MTIHKLEVSDYQYAAKLLRSLIHLAVNSIVEGKSNGKIFVDDQNNPNSAFVWSRNRTFLVGDSDNEEFNTAVNYLFEKHIYPGAQEVGINGFSLSFTPESWGDPIKQEILEGKHPVEDYRQYFRFKQLRHNWRELLPDGFSLHPVNRDLLGNNVLGNLEVLMEEMQSERPSVRDFLEKSFGYCVVHEDELVAWCLSEYNSKDRCEVGIETQSGFQRMGLAKITSSALIEHALEIGITNIGWHCISRNKASIAAAKSVGFDKICDYPSYWGMFDDVINLAVNGNLQFERNAYQEAINWYLKAIEAGEVPAWVYWNTACAYAHLDQKEAAITNLNQAVELGFTDLEYIQKSKHFIRWHQTEDWKALLHKLAVG